TVCLAQLAELTDIFSRLNDLNLSMQGRDTNILNLYDQVNTFIKKNEFCKSKYGDKDFTCFPLLHAYVTDVSIGENEQRKIKEIKVDLFLAHLTSEFKSYLSNIQRSSAQLDRVGNPFLLSDVTSTSLPVSKELLELSSGCGLQRKFSDSTLTQFRCLVQKEYAHLGNLGLTSEKQAY
ncbi:unnamed protein product, partial [Lepidochelys kempii]